MPLADEIMQTRRLQSLRGNVFTGVVVENNDPRQQQRVKVRISTIHRGVPNEYLPWATKKDTGVAAGGGVGTIDVPPIGARVRVEFLDDSGYNPFYFGSPSSDDVGIEDLLPDYPHTYGRRDHAGNAVFVNTATNEIVVSHVTGTSVKINGAGEVIISAAKVNIHADEIDMRASGNINLNAGGVLNLRGGDIKTSKKVPGDESLVPNAGAPQAPEARTAGTRPVIPPIPDENY
jgi:hypothetical protein